MPDASGDAAAGSGSPGDLEGIFDESLGDFDGEMQRERAGMASTGQGSSQSAGQREAGDASAVKDAGMGGASGGGIGGAGGMGDMPSSGGMAGGQQSGDGSSGSMGGDAESESGSDSAAGGSGQSDVQSGLEGRDVETSERDGAMVAEIPEDIPQDGTGEDQVAKQIREAAMAETDPDIREALWEEYRRHTGIK
jgi:hypothetical protein